MADGVVHGLGERRGRLPGLDQVESLAKAAHKAAETLDSKNAGMAGLLHEAADTITRLVEERDEARKGKRVAEIGLELGGWW